MTFCNATFVFETLFSDLQKQSYENEAMCNDKRISNTGGGRALKYKNNRG